VPCRSALYSIFIVSNVIVCSVSVWNLLIAKNIERNVHIDVFCVFLGGFALAFIFPMILLEYLHKQTVVFRIWFELLWVGIFFALEFAAAIALAAMVPSLQCAASVFVSIDNASCASTQILLAFTWIPSVTFLGYFLLLLVPTARLAKVDRRIWQRTVKTYPGPSETGQMHLTSNPSTPEPMLQRFSSFITPRRVERPNSNVAKYSYRGGLDPEYQIEHFQYPASTARPNLPPGAARPVSFVNSRSAPPANHQPSYSLTSSRALAPPPKAHHAAQRREESHIGDWPRQPEPLRVVRPEKSASVDHGFNTYPAGVSPARSRPSGPRSRSNSKDGDWVRPPALDLTKISSLESFKEKESNS